MGLDCLDLTQLHCIPTELIKSGEVFGWLKTLQKEGKIKRFGASVESMDEALICLEQEGLFSLQIIFNIFRQKPIEVLFEKAKAKKIALIIRLPLASGLLSGKISKDRISILQAADDIFIQTLKDNNEYDKIWQAFAVLLPVQTVGVMGDTRTYDNVCALRAVTSTDGMTADYFPFDQAFLGRVSNRIINEVRGINRVVYDITSKPPGTIEWE